ncbi:MAG: molybdopterin converting factor subunit 1 [Blastocatellia bacterium]|nr:molybdopterin converting factor subunit 1 [Chloracidobacterium sp.]MBL8185915.1 molybdopterin converting factor subunit 1 [Blastocatellia bacterium]HBE81864.1 molybdopterin converting factor subunit 1 [Blastocatellia bacterium]HRJ87413.1 molybdopterin converting factor subunit 1 [Pyrinomonadaceae bacterium]HRK49852.1 molybdopterin converting factor subunit 1 [Pyrinomonadaceae bacterium]
MTVRVLFFGAAADSAGIREAEVEVAKGLTAGELVESLKAKHPGLAGQKLLIAVDQEYVAASTPLEPGSEVAIFTPVSGG